MGRVMRISAAARPTKRLPVSMMVQTPLPKGSFCPVQPSLPLWASRQVSYSALGADVLSPLQKYKESKGGKEKMHVFFSQQRCPSPGLIFCFVLFHFSSLCLQKPSLHLCVNKSPVEVLPLHISLPVPS